MGSVASLAELRVSDTLERACAVDLCAGAGGGMGMGVYDGGWIEATGFLVTGSALAGVQLASGGSMDLHDGEVSWSPIGANVQVEGYDLDRLQDRVRWVDNGANLDAGGLPVPDPSSPL